MSIGTDIEDLFLLAGELANDYREHVKNIPPPTPAELRAAEKEKIQNIARIRAHKPAVDEMRDLGVTHVMISGDGRYKAISGRKISADEAAQYMADWSFHDSHFDRSDIGWPHPDECIMWSHDAVYFDDVDWHYSSLKRIER